MLGRIIPAYDWLRNYRRSDWPSDLAAGAVVAVMLVPQGMAYAILAGLPPVMGLYASTIPLLVYAAFGSSRHLAVGPVAIISMLIFERCSSIAEPGSADYVNAVSLLCVMVGAIQVAMGLLRLGFLVNFLSHAVVSGLTSAAAILIALSQLKHLLGISLASQHSVFRLLAETGRRIGETHLATLLLSVGCMILLLFFKMRWPRFPAAILVVIVATVIVRVLRLNEAGVSIVGSVPAGLPRPSLPVFDVETVRALFPAGLTIVLVGFVESLSIAQVIAVKERYRVAPNRELGALGLANIVAALSSGFPITGGFSRTAVNHQAGAKTGMACLVTAAIVLLTLLFLTPLFHYLPNAALAAIIVVAVAGLVDLRTAKKLLTVKLANGLSLVLTFGATLALGVEGGVLLGAVFSMFVFIWRSAHPHTAELGYVAEEGGFRNVKRYPHATTYPDILILRVDASLYFANMAFLEDFLRRAVQDRPGVRWIVMDFSGVNDIDGCAVEALERFMEVHHEAGIEFALAGMKGPVRDVVGRAGWPDLLGKRMQYVSTQQAVEDLLKNTSRGAIC
ncbi:MAG: sulfate permease [Pirellulaceae bacterium]|jgi:SulP family sulfate permease|nr:sulfate permease [Thermoguttaceae bacterium]NLZ00310.1 sulfate permease [Pirellulaceae bacterium]